MAGGPWGDQRNNLLSGLFGSFQQAAQQHLDTSTIWQNLRTNAASFYYQANGIAPSEDFDEVQALGSSLLSQAGVNAANVSIYRGIAGSWLQAKENLSNINTEDQITGAEVFVPPWARTAEGIVPSRYRVRVQLQVGEAGLPSRALFRTYELSGPLTNLDDVFSQVQLNVFKEGSSLQITRDELQDISSYEIEQI